MPRLLDVLALVFAIGTIGAAASMAYTVGQGESLARIQAGDETYLFPLDEPRRIQPLEEAGTCIIEMAEGGVRVVSSECPQQICMSMGTISATGQWIACLPHKVFIDVVGGESPEGVDGGTY